MENLNKPFCAVLCIDAVENSISSGRFFIGDLSCEQTFHGLDRFLLELDEQMNSMDCITYDRLKTGVVWHPGKVASFKVQIKFRRNASWQGSVMWLETRHEEHFRSALELLSFIDRALVPAQKQRMCPSSLKIAK